MASFDAESLFTNIPVEESIDICVELLFIGNPNIDSFTINDFHELLNLDDIFKRNGYPCNFIEVCIKRFLNYVFLDKKIYALAAVAFLQSPSGLASRKNLNLYSCNTFYKKNKTLEIGIQGNNPHIFL